MKYCNVLTLRRKLRYDVTDLDQEFLRSCDKPHKTAPTPDLSAEEVIQEGERNGTLTSLGGSMRSRGMSHDAIEAALLAENAARCDPPLADDEVRSIARSLVRYAPGDGQVAGLPPTSASGGAECDWKNLPRFDPSKTQKTKWLCEGLIPEGAIIFIVGDAGAYKSTFALALCAAISTGDEFLDRATKKRRVLYLDNENPPDVLRQRNESMALGLEKNMRLRLWTIYETRQLPRPGGPELLEIVRRSAAQGRKPLIVFDHWSSFLKSGDGGETTGQTSALLQAMKKLCGAGATILVLGHTRKYDKSIYYGGGDILAKADAMHTFIVTTDALNQNIVRVECFLKRHGGKHTFAIQPVVTKNPRDNSSGVARFKLVKDPLKEERWRKIDRLIDLIKHNPNLSQRELARRAMDFGLGRDEAEKLLKQGTGKHWTVSHGPKRKLTYVVMGKKE